MFPFWRLNQRCFFMQYVSALRPPNVCQPAADGSKPPAVNDKDGGQVECRRRVYSLTYPSSAKGQRDQPSRRSLHNVPFSSHHQVNWSVEEELKRRRRQAGFDQSYGEIRTSDSDSDPEFGEATETDEHEWKQVSEYFQSFQNAVQIFYNINNKHTVSGPAVE